MRDWIGTVVSLVGCLLSVGAFVVIVRKSGFRPSSTSGRLSPERRREVLRVIRGSGDTEDAEVREVAQEIAARRLFFGPCAGIFLTAGGQLIRVREWPLMAGFATAMVLAVIGGLLFYRDMRRARRFR